jgi:hypothetical protein
MFLKSKENFLTFLSARHPVYLRNRRVKLQDLLKKLQSEEG